MAENEEKATAPKPAVFSRPASTSSSSALSDTKATARAPPVPATPFTLREDLIDQNLYDVRLRELSALDLKKMERQATSPLPSTSQAYSDKYSANDADAQRFRQPLHHSNYQKVLQSEIDSLKPFTITNANITQGHALLRKMEYVFSMSNVLTLMNGARQPPEESADNPTGYKPPLTRVIDNIEYRLAADDCGLWNHDYRRSFGYLYYSIDQSAYHLSQEGFLHQDPVRIYTDIKNHFHGHSGKDMIRIDRLIQDYKPDHSVSIQKDIVRLDNIFLEYEYTLQKPMYDEMKLARFMSLFQFDKRPAVEMCLANLSFVNCTYGQAFQAVMRLSNIIDPGARHQMKSLGTNDKKTELCRAFAAGKCKFGGKCKYLHKGPSPDTATAPPTTKHAPADKTPSKGKRNPPAYITTAHRELIGPPTGKPSEGNPTGYSRNQMKALNVLTRGSDAPPSSATAYNDSWRDGSIMNALSSTSTSGQKRGQMNVLLITAGEEDQPAPAQIPPAIDTTLPPLIDEDDIIPPLIDIVPPPLVPTPPSIVTAPAPSSTPPPPISTQSTATASASSEVDDLDPVPNLETQLTSPVRCAANENPSQVRKRVTAARLTQAIRSRTDRSIREYNNTIQDVNEPGDLTQYIHWIMTRQNDKTSRSIFTVLGWFDRSSTYHYSDVRPDIRGGSLPLMALLYGIGRDWLGATVAPMFTTVAPKWR